MTDFVAIVTARRNSVRLPGKNMLPVGGVPLAVRAIQFARSLGLDCVVTTDIPELHPYCEEAGAKLIPRPLQLSAGLGQGMHDAAIQHALKASGNAGRPYALLQPTTPFRLPETTLRCLSLALTEKKPVRTIYCGHLAQHKLPDGNIFACPNGQPIHASGDDWLPVESDWLESLQVDTPSDYATALRLCL